MSLALEFIKREEAIYFCYSVLNFRIIQYFYSFRNSENNQIEEVFQIENKNKNDASNEVSTEVRIQCFGNNVKHLLLGLLDTGATGIFVKRNALKGINHQVEQVNIKVKGRYSQSQLKEIAVFDI